MSESTLNPIQQAIEESALLKEREYEIRKNKVDIQHQELTERLAKKKAFGSLPIGKNIRERSDKLIIENEEYIKLAKGAVTFLGMDVFKDKVALFPRNIILIGAETGTGKSTTCANFIRSYLKEGRRVLIVTNEENRTDILNRVIFLNKGWVYSNHDEITEEQLVECKRLYPILMQRIEIIDDMFNGIGGTTTTLEGIVSIYKTLKEQAAAGEKPYDAVLIDYIQNIRTSVDAPSLAQWQVLQRLGSFIDNFKGEYNAPTILFSQLKAATEANGSYKERIEGYKAISNHATTAMEVKMDRENLRTEWIFRKNRFKDAVGISVITGYDRGRYVEYNQEFMNVVRLKNDAKKHKELLSKTFNKKE